MTKQEAELELIREGSAWQWKWVHDTIEKLEAAIKTNKDVQHLFGRIDEALSDYYKAARRRCREVIEAEEEWRSSDECIRDTLEGNEHLEFDEFGGLVR